MDRIEEAIQKFIEEWKKEDNVEGIVLTGSYVAGYYFKHSDIDIFIILSDNTNIKELRGNRIIGGVMIEYFGYPIKEINRRFEEEWEENYKVLARILLTGKVLYDKSGKVIELVEEARKWFNKHFKEWDKKKVEYFCYDLWDMLEGLKDVYERNSMIFDLLYYKIIIEILEKYPKIVKAEIFPLGKLDLYLFDENYRKRTLREEFPDKEFISLLIDCLEARDKKEKLKKIEKLVEYIWNKVKFNINGWELIIQ